MNKLLGISLALVMLTGSVPLGFAEPLRVQLEQEIETKNLQCDNPNHVLVERDNGKLACLTEKTALKIGWKIIKINLDINKILDEFSVEWSDETLDDNPSEIVYEFPLIAKQPEITGIQNGEPGIRSYSKIELQISNLPKLGDIAEITAIVTDNFGNGIIGDSIEDGVSFLITNNFQVITGLEDFTQIDYDEYGYTFYGKEIPVEANQIQIFKITVVAFGAGEANITARTSGDDPTAKSSFDLVIGENETLLKDDYYKKYPAALAAKEASKKAAKQLALEEERLEKERLLEQGCQFVENIGMWCPPTEEELEAMKNNTENISIETEEELRAYLKTDGASDEEIEELVREAYPEHPSDNDTTIQSIEISDARITLETTVDMTQEATSTAIAGVDPPWSTLTFPEEFKLGEPFEIEYTWTFLKTYSEGNGDEYPSDDLEKNPWAQEWQPYDEWEDDNDLRVWQEKRGYESYPTFIVKITGDDRLKVLTEEFVPHDWAADDARLGVENYFTEMYPLEGQLDLERTHSYDLQEHTETITLQFDEVVDPPNHTYTFEIGKYQNYNLSFHFNDGKGYIGTNYIKWFNSEIASSIASESVEIPNPLPCKMTDKMWNTYYTLEQQRWELIWGEENQCDGKPDYVPPEDRPKPVYRTIEEQLENSTKGTKEWLERNSITENIRNYLENTLHITSEQLKHFFETYPELEFQSFIPSNFFLIPSAFASSGNHIIQAYGKFLVEDYTSTPVSPIGLQICLYDKRNDGSYEVLKYGIEDACSTMKSSLGSYSIRAINTDPDDQSGVDLIVGIKSENDIIKITNYNLVKGNDIIHGDGDIYQAYAPNSNIVNNVDKTKDKIIKLPDVTLNKSSDFSRVYSIAEQIFNAHDYVKRNFGTTINQVTIEYQPNFNQGGAHYHNWSAPSTPNSVNIINLDNDDYLEFFTINHEYGHHTMKSIYVDDNKGSWPFIPAGLGSHMIEKADTNRNRVWVEGWADFFVTLVTNDATHTNAFGNYNFEDRDVKRVFSSDFANGDMVEGNVAAVLWDLLDGIGEPNKGRVNQDDISGLKSNLWAVFNSPPATKLGTPQENFNEFISQWESKYSQFNINQVLLHNTYIDTLPIEPPGRSGDVIFSEPFETDFSEWTLSGDDDWEIERYRLERPPFAEGSQYYLQKVLRSENCDDTCILTLTNNIDLSKYYNVGLYFDYYISSAIDSSDNEGLNLQVSKDGGQTWSTLKEWTEGNSDVDDNWHLTDPPFDLSSYLSDEFSLRFISTSSSKSEDIQIGQLEIRGIEKIEKKSKPDRIFVPSAPIVTETQVHLSWNEPTSEGTSIIEYDIQRRLRTADSESNISTTPTTTSFSTIATVSAENTNYVDDDVESGVNYDYQIRAKNSEGYGEFSSVISVSIPDTTAPILVVSNDKSFEATAILTPLTATQIGNATATDNKDSNPVITNNVTTNTTFPLGDTIILWVATDSTGNNSTDTQTITIKDTTKPVLTIPSDITTEATAINTPITIGNASASDIFDVTITNNSTGKFPVGKTTITWNAVDTSGNKVSNTQTITITDTTKPTLIIPKDITIVIKSPNYLTNGENDPAYTGMANVTDNTEIEKFYFENTTLENDDNNPRLLTIIQRDWIAIDKQGNSVNATQIINFTDTRAIPLYGPADIIISSNSMVDMDYPYIIAGVNATITKDDVFLSNSDPTINKIIQRTFTATDDFGNTESVKQIITIVDTPKPLSLILPDDINVIVRSDSFLHNGENGPSLTGMANYTGGFGTVILTHQDTHMDNDDPNILKTSKRVWTVTDSITSINGTQTINFLAFSQELK